MESFGTLVVRVFTGRGQIPLVGATVAVTQKHTGGKPALIAIRAADENGKIPPISIPTPAAWQSEHPGGTAPFAICDVWADHLDYEVTVVEDVQIFGGVETLQEISMVPLPEHQSPRDAIDRIHVTPQPL